VEVSAPVTGMGLLGFPDAATGDIRVNKASEKISNSTRSRTVDHSLCA